MTRNNRNNTVTTTVVSRPAAARVRGNQTTVATSRPRALTHNTSRRRRRNDPAQSYSGDLHPDAHSYVNCLSDPFAYPPVKLGFGCLTQSQTCTLTSRYIGSAGADGHFCAYVIPSVFASGGAGLSGGLYISTNVGGTALGAFRVGWQNSGAVGSLFEEARVVSCGLRVTPMIPGTASPGGVFVASLPTTSQAQIDSMSPSSLIQMPLFTWGIASAGATATSRPIDPNSFTFHHSVVQGLSTIVDCPVTVPAIIVNGLPTGYSVLVEAVLQIEGIYGLGSQAQAVQSLQSTSAAPASGLTRAFHSVENMWNTVSRYLPAPASVRTAVSLANALLNPGISASSRPQSSSRVMYGRLLP